jgi:hypothetical protein
MWSVEDRAQLVLEPIEISLVLLTSLISLAALTKIIELGRALYNLYILSQTYRELGVKVAYENPLLSVSLT